MGRCLAGRHHSARAFTLTEVVVVIAIVAILIGMLLPAIQASREAVRKIQCGNNLAQTGIGLLRYNDSFGTFPSAAPT